MEGLEGVSQELSSSSHTVEAEQVDLEVKESNQSTVCQFYLQGKCRFDEKCRNIYCPLDLKNIRPGLFFEESNFKIHNILPKNGNKETL